MSVTRIRTNHEQLGSIGQTFGQEAEAVQRLRQQLQDKLNILQNGDWQGPSATKFYREMDGQVLPCLQRLATALDSSATLTQKASQLMKQTEEDVARLFKAGANGRGGVNGLGGVAAFASEGGPGTKGAGGSAGSGAGGANGGPTINNPQPAKGNSTPFQNTLFSKLDPKVQQLAAKSPTLMKELNDLARDKWNVNVVPHPANDPDTPSETFVKMKQVNIYQNAKQKVTPENATMAIAHELGIAKLNPPLLKIDTPKLTEDKFIKANLPLIKQAEGEGLFNEVAVRNEVLKGTGNKTDIGISDPNHTNWPEYQKLFDAEQKGTITHADAVNKMLNIYEDAVKNSNDGDDLNALYTKALHKDWDEFKRTGKVPPT